MIKRHTTHFDDCSCLTARYKIVINALVALQAHQKVVCGGCKGLSTICHILDRTFESLKKLDKDIAEL